MLQGGAIEKIKEDKYEGGKMLMRSSEDHEVLLPYRRVSRDRAVDVSRDLNWGDPLMW